MTWEELLEYMDNVIEWGQEMIKGWNKTTSVLQKPTGVAFASVATTSAQEETACIAAGLKHRVAFQNKLAVICEHMCKDPTPRPFHRGRIGLLRCGRADAWWDQLILRAN